MGTKKMGADWAKLFADAHEYGVRNNIGLNAQMDLYNNNQGRYIGENITNKDDLHIANTVHNYVKLGYLLRNKAKGVEANVNFPTNRDYR